jgi:D-alanyl-lipoteichoic acid acyltransferase DltB (MBOAT superfamily)
MYFNSDEFLIFFAIVVVGYFASPQRARWALLLVASYVFYAFWRVDYLILLLVSTGVDYVVGRVIPRAHTQRRRRLLLLASLTTNLGLLFSFKYFDFFNDAARQLFARFGLPYSIPDLDVLLPVGISFYTFQTLSYTIDVYRRKREPETHLGIFALYVSFFPQLVAGPIERSTHLLPQLRRHVDVDYDRITSGLKLMLWGFFKKLVIADRVGLYVDRVYGQPGEFQGLTVLVAIYLFAFQVFCDFSGYSDIAIGAARVLGFDLMQNFTRPYWARSISDFWRRWHISLMTWFRDYLYIPLGGNRVAAWRWHYNVLIVFVVSGLWHGANWTFLVWGAIHGALVVASNLTAGLRAKVGLDRFPRFATAWRIVFNFNLVCFAHIFFRASSLGDAFSLIQSLFTFSPDAWSLAGLGLGIEGLGAAVAALLAMEAVHAFQETGRSVEDALAAWPTWQRWSAYYAVIFATLAFGVFDGTQFIYFQF